MKKLSLLAASVAIALTGCGGSDGNSSSKPTTKTEVTTNKFIDAAVEGLYYTTSSGKTGTTDSEGQFTAAASDTITFYIGGENGLKVGAASNCDVLTPFEAAGKYARALNLAILLQSMDNEFGSASDDVLTIPELLRAPDAATLEKMADLSLDDRDSVEDFLTAIGVSSIVTENEALEHMKGAFGSLKRGTDGSNPFVTPGKIVRYIDVTQQKYTPSTESNKTTFVHADKLMASELFERTRGMTEMTFEVMDGDEVTVLAGSNDSSISEGRAAKQLTCMQKNIVDCDTSSVTPDGKFTLSSPFEYMLRDAEQATLTDEVESADFKPFNAEKISGLNHYTPNHVWDDRDEGELTADWVRNTTSGSYDPVTGIYTEIVKKEELKTDKNNANPRTTERVAYYYEVPSEESERYVDFTGTWQTKEFCDDGQIAVSTMVFDGAGATTTGQECRNSPSTPTDMGEEHNSYTQLGTIDFWWFGQSGRESKATLTELNTVVRFCDEDGYMGGNPCSSEYFVKWEYQPAGTNWDEGLLIRRKMDKSGNTDGRVSIIQKIQ